MNGCPFASRAAGQSNRADPPSPAQNIILAVRFDSRKKACVSV